MLIFSGFTYVGSQIFDICQGMLPIMQEVVLYPCYTALVPCCMVVSDQMSGVGERRRYVRAATVKNPTERNAKCVPATLC